MQTQRALQLATHDTCGAREERRYRQKIQDSYCWRRARSVVTTWIARRQLGMSLTVEQSSLLLAVANSVRLSLQRGGDCMHRDVVRSTAKLILDGMSASNFVSYLCTCLPPCDRLRVSHVREASQVRKRHGFACRRHHRRILKYRRER